MKAGVLADTHIPWRAKDLPKKVYDYFKVVELILHAGDLEELGVLEALKSLAPVEAVAGNMDPWEVKEKLPFKKVITVGRFKIGLIHGWGSPLGLEERVKAEFKEGIDCIVYGHSHRPKNQIVGGVLFFNPGSPTDKIFSPYNSFGILEINDGIRGKIIRV